MKPIRLQVGGIVTGTSFYGRERDLEIFGEKIREGKNILFSGPRRTGKSSLIKEFMERYDGQKNLIYIDLQKCSDIEAFSNALLSSLTGYQATLAKAKDKAVEGWNTISAMIKELDLDGYGIKTGKIQKDEMRLLERLSGIISQATNEQTVFFFDEFADYILSLLKGGSTVEYFLKWFREMRQSGKIRVVITGSINIANTIDEIKMSHLLNDTEPFSLIPLKEAEIRDLFQRLLKYRDVAIKGEALTFALSKLKDGHIYFIQAFADEISNQVGREALLADAEEIGKIYIKLTNGDWPALAHFHSRLEDYLPEYSPVCHSILAHLSVNPLSKDDLYPYISETVDKKVMNKLLRRLSDEGYIVIEDGNCRFVSTLLADWWRNKYEHER